MLNGKLKRLSALALSLMVGLAMTGCSGENISSDDASAQVQESDIEESAVEETETENMESAEKVDELKTLSIAVAAELTTLYPLNMDEQNLSATRLCYESLVNYENGEITPWLAESWELSEDGLALTFNLRDDVYYHDGPKLSAEGVKVNFEYKKNNPNFRAWPAVVNVKDIEVVDETTITFHYDTPFYGYLSDFSFREIMVLVSPDVIEPENFQTLKDVVGTGPYKQVEVKSGEYVKFEKNEAYWGTAPYYDEIYVKYIPEASSRMLALEKGEVDVIYGSGLITWDDFSQAKAYQNVNAKISDADTKTVYFVLNAGNEMLSDLTIREAIAYGIDKEGICQGLTYGNQAPADDMFCGKFFIRHSDEYST